MSANMTTSTQTGSIKLPVPLQKYLNSTFDTLEFFKSQFHLSTLLAIGMCLQALAFLALPHYMAVAPAVVLLGYKLLSSKISSVAENWLVNEKWVERMSASIPNEDGSVPEKGATNGVVCFVVGAQLNHPMGIFGPGIKEAGDFFNDIWRDAEADPKKWGFLSRTPSLTGSHKSGKGGGGPYLVTLSYWKSIDHLRTFAAQSSHAEVRRWWERTRQQWPHIGIFHETYDVPPCHYETIYENFHPFGMGAIGLGKEKGQALRKAEGKGWKTMDDRMGRGE